jgi:UDP-2-acetamido-3-amino-2,3-dideoxy-glucuronate N-acetyltransferase
LMVGVPARRIGWRCQCGERLADSGSGTCQACGSTYESRDGEVRQLSGPNLEPHP